MKTYYFTLSILLFGYAMLQMLLFIRHCAVHVTRSSASTLRNQLNESKTNGNSNGNGNVQTTTKRPPTPTPPCALLFFGVGRKFKQVVYPSLNTHILEQNPTCDIFVHTYNVTNVHGGATLFTHETSKTSSSGDNIYTEHHPDTGRIDPNELKILTQGHPNRIRWDTEESFQNQRKVDFYRTLFPEPSGWNYPNSMDNMIRQWHSIASVWDIMEQHEQQTETKYQRVGLFRPDVVYTHPISINNESEEAVIPSMMYTVTTWGGYNDRLFYGKRSYAKIWATERFNSVNPYMKWQKKQQHLDSDSSTSSENMYGLHSENFMRYLLTERWPMPLSIKDICMMRVRSSGLVLTNDCDLLDVKL